jgi:hypothetical protein
MTQQHKLIEAGFIPNGNIGYIPMREIMYRMIINQVPMRDFRSDLLAGTKRIIQINIVIPNEAIKL